MKVFFSDRAYAAVLAETTEKIRTETGGLFLGALEDDCWYIVEAVDPGPKSVFEVAYFEYDQQYTEHLINKIASLYHAKLELIGLWHRHPGSFDVFSSTDNETNAKYAAMRRQGAVSAIVNIDPEFRMTMYHAAPPCAYSRIDYEVGDELIPEKYLRYKSPERFKRLMNKILYPEKASAPVHSFKAVLEQVISGLAGECCTERIEEPAMEEQAVKEKLIDGLIDDISYLSEQGVALSIVQGKKYLTLVQDIPGETVKLFCMYDQNTDRIVIQYLGKAYYYEPGLMQKLLAGEGQEEQPEHQGEQTERTGGEKEVSADAVYGQEA